MNTEEVKQSLPNARVLYHCRLAKDVETLLKEVIGLELESLELQPLCSLVHVLLLIIHSCIGMLDSWCMCTAFGCILEVSGVLSVEHLLAGFRFRVVELRDVLSNEVLLFLGELGENGLGILFIDIKHVQAIVTVLCQVFLFTALPYLSKVEHGLNGEASLLLGELTVLPKGVQTDNELAWLGEELLFLDGWPCSLLGDIDLTCLLLFLLEFFILFIPFFLRFLEIFDLLLVALIVRD